VVNDLIERLYIPGSDVCLRFFPHAIKAAVGSIGFDLFVPLIIEIILKPVGHRAGILHRKRTKSIFDFRDGAHVRKVR